MTECWNANQDTAPALDDYIKETQEELYGPQADPRTAGTIHGGYIAGDIDRQGQFHRGRCDIALAGLHSPEDFRRTLRHELLGRFALNTFTPEEKRAVLAAIANTCSQDPGEFPSATVKEYLTVQFSRSRDTFQSPEKWVRSSEAVVARFATTAADGKTCELALVKAHCEYKKYRKEGKHAP